MTSQQEGAAVFQLRKNAEAKEEKFLYPRAAFSKEHSRYCGAEEDHRLPYKRDVDRIIHSKAFARYTDKTQVAYLVENDHITHRGLHVQLVSNFARGIAETLGLNLDLVEAISLGHDVGHPPFGHEGEHYLSALSKKYGAGPFAHSYQSCRLLFEIEPKNLGLAVYDGFLCHDGGMKDCFFTPNWNKSWDDHFSEREMKKNDPDVNIMPATLEGCLVKLCDTISYIGRDIEDAISLGILMRDQIPDTPLGRTNGEILSCLAVDIIEASYNKDYITISPVGYEAIKELRNFNFRNIYTHPLLKRESQKVKGSYAILFEELLKGAEKEGEGSHLWRHFLKNKPESYLERTSTVQHIVDYIAGMTDTYFVRTLERLVIPTRIEIAGRGDR